jgi:hypothetical protein
MKTFAPQCGHPTIFNGFLSAPMLLSRESIGGRPANKRPFPVGSRRRAPQRARTLGHPRTPALREMHQD